MECSYCKYSTFSTIKALFSIEFMHAILIKTMLKLIYFCRSVSQPTKTVKIISLCHTVLSKCFEIVVAEVIEKIQGSQYVAKIILKMLSLQAERWSFSSKRLRIQCTTVSSGYYKLYLVCTCTSQSNVTCVKSSMKSNTRQIHA